ncbi:MAG: hypothetical protein EAZ55_00655 [Cytophagales bacterium]|nr:MAG: hypothetical protein EAZ55_00655 [Cytophagales bacterium]
MSKFSKDDAEDNKMHEQYKRLKDTVKKWQEKGFTQIKIVEKVNDFAKKNNRNIKLSTSVLSRMLKPENISLRKYVQLNEILRQIEQEGDISPLEKKQDIGTIINKVVGKYHIFHLNTEGNALIKNVLNIETDGTVSIEAHDNIKHYGNIHIFENTLAAININRLNDKPFFYQITFNFKGYLGYGISTLQHIWAVSTTISLTQFPMANIRLIFPFSEEDKKQKITGELVHLDSAIFAKLKMQYPVLEVFTEKNTKLTCHYEINAMY